MISSFGTENQNFTLGAGVPFVIGDIVDGDFSLGGAVVGGGKIVISKTASLITENWVLFMWNYNTYAVANAFGWVRITLFPSIAIRIAGSRFSWDIGITMPVSVWPSFDYEFDPESQTDSTTFAGYNLNWLLGAAIPIPIIGFTYRIN